MTSEPRTTTMPPFNIKPGERYTDAEGKTWELTDHGQWKDVQMPSPETTDPYRVTCRDVEWEGKRGVLINTGGDPAVGYAIWSKEGFDRLVDELKSAGARAWPKP